MARERNPLGAMIRWAFGGALLAMAACATPAVEDPTATAPSLPPPSLSADAVLGVVAGGDPFTDAAQWLDGMDPEVRFVEYSRSAPIVGRAALSTYLTTSHKARGALTREVVRSFALGPDVRAVQTNVRDRDGAWIGSTLWAVKLQGGRIVEVRGYGQPEAWSSDTTRTVDTIEPQAIGTAALPEAEAAATALLAAEAKGEAPPTSVSFEPASLSVEVSGVLLPPVDGGRWQATDIVHTEIHAAGPWVVALSRLAVTLQPHDIPIVLHRALVIGAPGGAVETVQAYLDPLEVGPVGMDFRSLGSGVDLPENETGGKVYGPMRSWCCRQSKTEAVECWMLDPAHEGMCRRAGWREYACRHRQGCVGNNCFCCDNGIDAACEPEPKEPERRGRPPRSKRLPQGTIWSPY
ncbi:MAG: hypothetical protein AAF721_32760 [Myxococcota bacterium]